MRILVVEDDKQVGSFVCRGLREQLYTVDHAEDGEEGLFLAQTSDYDLVVLDLGLPKRNGFEVVQALRKAGGKMPVLMLTGRDQLADKVSGLNAGADDYLTKPCQFEELLARVRALLRRRQEMPETRLTFADLEVDTLKRRGRRGGRDLNLTTREYEFLEYFVRHPNQVVTREALAARIWKNSERLNSNVINVHIGRLRRKVDADFSAKLLQTVRDQGYILRSPASEPSEVAEASAST